jgi:hypothetical protein
VGYFGAAKNFQAGKRIELAEEERTPETLAWPPALGLANKIGSPADESGIGQIPPQVVEKPKAVSI